MFRKGDQIGPYTLLDKLGRGGFGVVWLAEKRAALVVTKVALKMPNDDDIDLDAVRREAALWVHASGHPNVLPIIDADIYDDQVVIVSEYAPDGSLATWLRKNGGIAPTVGDAIEMTSGILSGLSHLHSRKIIHRDLKPANVLLQGRTPRLVDFGLARVMRSNSHSRTVSGTYSYMPPETFEGNRSEQTDIYSVGVILYEMLTGRLPYPQTTDAALIGAILHGSPDPLPEYLSRPLRAVIERAMDKDPEKRYRSAAEMLKALQDSALTFHSMESYSPVTEVMPSYLNVELLSGKSVPQPSAEAEKPTPPTPQNIETASYETSALNLPATDPSMSPVSKEVEEKFIQSQKPNMMPIIHPPTPSVEKPVSGKTTSPNAPVVTSKEDLQPLAPTLVSHENQYGFSKDTKRSVEMTNRNNVLIVAGVIALAIFFGLSVFALGFIAYKLIGGSTDNKNENQITEETQGDKAKKKEISGRLIETLTAKTSVNAVAISKDGKLIAAAGDDGKVRLWKNNDYKMPAFTLGDSKDIVRSIAISPNGHIVASSGDDNTIHLWNTSNGNSLHKLKGHGGSVFRILFSEDGQTLVSASGDKTIRFWDVVDGREKKRLIFPDKSEAMINISPNLRLVAFYLDTSKRVRLWDLDENRVIEMRGDKFVVQGGGFSPDNSVLALGSKDGAVRLYNAENGEQTRVLQSISKETGDVVFNSNGQIVGASYGDGRICLWDAKDRDGLLLKTLEGHEKFVLALEFSKDNYLVSGGMDEKLRLWQIESE
jgi:WD40 repeat protein/serine/threonine protein kinase